MRLILAVVIMAAASVQAQTTTTGTINAVLINKSGIALTFTSNASGVSLTGSGSNTATAAFGTISAYGALAAGVTRPSVTAANFTVRTPFNVTVTSSGITTSSYNLYASLASAAPTGITYRVNAVSLTTLPQVVQNNATYTSAVSQNLDLIVSTAAPASGGPAVGTVVSRTINFTAVAN